MDTLRLVEVAGDGSLVLMTGDGRRFSLGVDEQVRSAVRRSRNGTTEAAGDDRPGPREVQARIRAGADAVQVAAQTGLDVDYVRRYEGPVLAERAHVADLARGTAVDRGGDPTLSLERVVLDVLTGEGYAVDDIRWDSRKVEGTRWQVVVTSREGVARSEATWGFDTATRSLEPVDAEAERLTGVERRRRLSAVRDSVFDVERPAPAPAGRGGTVELLDALARQRGRRPVTRPAAAEDAQPVAAEDAQPAAAEDARPAEQDEAGTAGAAVGAADDGAAAGQAPPDAGDAPGGPPAAEEPAGEVAAPDEDHGTVPPGLRVVAGRRRDQRPAGTQHDAGLSIEPDLLTELELDQPPLRTPDRAAGRPGAGQEQVDVRPAPQAQPVAAGDRRSRRRRSAVPSWDEIVFGAKREDG